MTVFTIPPHHVTFEIGDEPLRCLKCVNVLLLAKMSVVALSSLIVVTYDAYSIYDICQPILEGVSRPRYRLWRLPYHQFSKCGF